MNVICIGYFDKHSRFFLDIREWIKTNTDHSVKFKTLSIHFGGYLYNILRFKYSTWINFKAWFKIFTNRRKYEKQLQSKAYKGIDIEKHIEFHLKLNKQAPVDALCLQAMAYIDIFEAMFNKIIPNYLLTLGDSRLCIEIAVEVAKQKKIKVFFIEQGPFKTTFFDDKGVNANLSIRKNTELMRTITEHNNPNQQKAIKYNRSPIYRGLDILLMTLFENTVIYPPDLKFTDINSYRKKNSSKKSKIDIKNMNYILFPMQIPLDVNMIYHSPNYNSHLEIVKDLFEHLPDKFKLILREHPLYIGKYDNELYEYINTHNICIDNTSTLNKALDSASVVIVNNSTVGIEAISRYKPVIVLGNAFYDNKKVCFKLNNKCELSELIKLAILNEPNIIEIDRFINLLYNTVMLKGGVTDKNLISSKTIANHLISNF